MNIPTPPMIQDPATKVWQTITLTGNKATMPVNETSLFDQLYGKPDVFVERDMVEVVAENGIIMWWREDEIRYTPFTVKYQVQIRNTGVDSLAFLYSIDPDAAVEFLDTGVFGDIYTIITCRDIDMLLDHQDGVVQYIAELI